MLSHLARIKQNVLGQNGTKKSQTQFLSIFYQKAQSPFIMSVCLSVTPAVSGVRRAKEHQKLSSVPRTLYQYIFNLKKILKRESSTPTKSIYRLLRICFIPHMTHSAYLSTCQVSLQKSKKQSLKKIKSTICRRVRGGRILYK